jgi:hypothetical protein
LADTANILQLPSSGPVAKGSGPLLASTENGRILNYVEERLEQCRKARLQFERSWYTNLAFYFGKQYVQWSPSFGTVSGSFQRLYEPPAPSWRVRLVSNKIRPIVRTEIAKLTKETPEAYVIPASSDDDDIAAARAGERLFEYFFRSIKMKRVIRREAFWQVLCGTGFTKDWYDPTSPDSAGLPGRIRCEHVTPFHFYVPEMEEEELENQPYVIHVIAKTPDWVEDHYGVRLEPDSSSNGGVLEQRFLQAMGIQQGNAPDHVAIKEMWVKPCGEWPEGAVITWANEQILSATPSWPFEYDDYPFTKFEHIETGRFYGESAVTDLIPIQKEYNRTRSQIIESKNKMSKPQLAAPRGSIDANKLTSEPGLVVFYTPGFEKPTPIPLLPIPDYVIQELDRCQRDMDDISSQHEITKGQAPPGVTAATAISYLQEQDDSKLANSVSSVEEGIEKIGKHFLVYVQQFWDLARTIQVTGSDGQYESFMLSKADIKGNTDLNIQAGSGMPRSRAAKQAFIMQLGQMGWIPPDRALRYLDMAETGRLYEEMQVDQRQAQRENLQMLQGVQVQVNSWDEHMIHVAEHNNERKKQRFENAPDQVKQWFETHVRTHQMQMQMMQQQMGGAPPGAPAPPGGPHPVTSPVEMPPINPLQGGGING